MSTLNTNLDNDPFPVFTPVRPYPYLTYFDSLP